MAERSKVAEGYMLIRADMSKLSGDLQQAKSMFRSSLKDIASTTGGILAAAGIGGLVGGLKSLASHFINASSMMENFTISLGVLLKSELKAKNLMLEVERLAAVTPFTTQSLAQAITQLKVFGFQAKELIPTIKIIGDQAAASPLGMVEGVQRISYAMGQIRSNGRIMSREMRMLALAGVPAWDILSKKMNKSVADLRDMVRKGTVTAAAGVSAILEGMAVRTGGMMVKQSQTWTGLMSTLQDNLRIFARQAGEPLFDVSKMGLKSITKWFDSKEAQGWVDYLRKSFEKLIALVKSGLQSPWLPIIQNMGKSLAISIGLAASLTLASDAVGFLSSGIKSLLSPMGLLTAGAGYMATQFVKALNGEHGRDLRDGLTDILRLSKEIGKSLMIAFEDLSKWLKGTWAEMFGSDVQGKQDSFFQSLLDWIKEGMDWAARMTADMALSWEYVKSAGQLAWLKIEEYATSEFDAMKDLVAGLVAGMQQAAMEIGAFLEVAFDNAFTSLKVKMTGAITDIGVLEANPKLVMQSMNPYDLVEAEKGLKTIQQMQNMMRTGVDVTTPRREYDDPTKVAGRVGDAFSTANTKAREKAATERAIAASDNKAKQDEELAKLTAIAAKQQAARARNSPEGKYHVELAEYKKRRNMSGGRFAGAPPIPPDAQAMGHVPIAGVDQSPAHIKALEKRAKYLARQEFEAKQKEQAAINRAHKGVRNRFQFPDQAEENKTVNNPAYYSKSDRDAIAAAKQERERVQGHMKANEADLAAARFRTFKEPGDKEEEEGPTKPLTAAEQYTAGKESRRAAYDAFHDKGGGSDSEGAAADDPTGTKKKTGRGSGSGDGEMIGVAEFAKQLQASLVKSAADVAAEKTKDAVEKSEGHLEMLVNRGIKIINPGDIGSKTS